MNDLQYRLYLAATLAALGFPAGQTDIENLGEWEIRTYRLNGVQVEVNEETGDVVVSDDDYRVQFRPGGVMPVPEHVIAATVGAMLADPARRESATPAPATVTQAAADLVETLKDPGVIAEAMTCDEVTAVTDLMNALNRWDLAKEWLDHHAIQDDEGDRHYRVPVAISA
ncbi:hypothetical protein ACQP25_44520 (plasmid) [Microtetraspora malaysiensis]|uniref:hypothetical protein n=1 Tax=Microtetraspora malaysiensis TaxID=161358 RepID=UPI003D89DB38